MDASVHVELRTAERMASTHTHTHEYTLINSQPTDRRFCVGWVEHTLAEPLLPYSPHTQTHARTCARWSRALQPSSMMEGRMDARMNVQTDEENWSRAKGGLFDLVTASSQHSLINANAFADACVQC